ncbi:MAG: hypothetical protein AB2L07_19725 [Thermoanaerobaculaceae bacterium]
MATTRTWTPFTTPAGCSRTARCTSMVWKANATAHPTVSTSPMTTAWLPGLRSTPSPASASPPPATTRGEIRPSPTTGSSSGTSTTESAVMNAERAGVVVTSPQVCRR